MRKAASATMMGLAALVIAGCADNYAVEGAAVGAAAGAAIGAVTGADVGTAAAVGAAAGAAGGYFLDKDEDCDGYDRDGRIDDDCYGTSGYPVDPRY
ncbi:MAG TPA: YMGG-like glycine zipper-containing protein [Croceicoccus sp.]|nr:YMGG-like glycine zipper-containing protein [Croceicoccus sp.]